MLRGQVGQEPYVAFPLHAMHRHGATDYSRDDPGSKEAFEERRPPPARDGCASKPKVLVADDEQIIANTLTIILNQSGFEACAVYSGEAAVEALNRFEPDVLVSDVIMPGMTGVEAAIAIRSQRPSCKVLLLSGQAAIVDLLQIARTRGYNFEILAKPVHPSALLARLRTDTGN